MNCSPPNKSNSRTGLTLIEVVVGSLILLIALVLMIPWMLQARERARLAQCSNQLREVGIALHTFSYSDPQGRFCTGAFDYRLDGSIDKFGWVADVRSIDKKVNLLCPGNEVRGSATLNDCIAGNGPVAPTKGKSDNAPVARVGVGTFHKSLTAAGSEAARVKVINAAIDQGLNTNYAASWFFVRGGLLMQTPLDDPTGINPNIFADFCTTLNGTIGPMTQRMLDNADVPASNIPFLGDAAKAAKLSTALTGLRAGTPLGMAFNRGPALVNDKSRLERFEGSLDYQRTEILSIIPQGFPKLGELVSDGAKNSLGTTQAVYAAASDKGQASEKFVLQDTRAWSVAHANQLALLMADGSVKHVEDQNGDGFLNPGFPLGNPGADGGGIPFNQRAKSFGYTDGVCEMSAFEIWNGALLNFQMWMKPQISWNDDKEWYQRVEEFGDATDRATSED